MRVLANDILEYCEEYSVGYGGLAPIGKPEAELEGFSVRVIGAEVYPGPPGGTDDTFGSSGTANVTVGETLWLSTS